MGRFRRKGRFASKGGKKKGEKDMSIDGVVLGGTGGPPFTFSETEKLRRYLIDYREGCERVAFPSDVQSVASDDATVVSSPTARLKGNGDGKTSALSMGVDDFATDDEMEENSIILVDPPEPTEVVIADQTFPALTDEVLSQPYLALPDTLNSKQRRRVHELCVEEDLYHSGTGGTAYDDIGSNLTLSGVDSNNSTSNRVLVISIHSDGFRFVPNFASDQYGLTRRIPVKACRPWYCRAPRRKVDGSDDKKKSWSSSRGDIDVEAATKEARERIAELLDQPGVCIRDEVDDLDLDQLDQEDLSTIRPPHTADWSWVLVNSAYKMKQCADELLNKGGKPTEVAFDMEMHNPSKFCQITCLIQITSNKGKEYVIDTLAHGVWDNVSLLQPLFGDPSIVKVGHAIGGMDVSSLHRDFGIFVINAFDTYEAAKVLKLKPQGLAAVAAHYGLVDSETYVQLKEKYQSSDWRRRPLTEPMIRYGRYDVHYLLAIRRLQMRDLVSRADLWPDTSSSGARIRGRGIAGGKSAQSQLMVAEALAATLSKIEQAEDDVDTDFADAQSRNSLATAADFADGTSSAPEQDDDEDEADGFYTPPSSEGSTGEKDGIKHFVAAKDLRMQLDVMQVITQSQQRCLDLWKTKTETFTRSATWAMMMKRIKDGAIRPWTASQNTLLEELEQWRIDVAETVQCLPSMVCPVDLLVLVAWKRPTHEATLRRIQYQLPELLEDAQSEFVAQMLSLVRASLERDGIEVATLTRRFGKSKRDPFYSSRQRTRMVLVAAAFVTVGATAVAIFLFTRRSIRRPTKMR